MTTDAPASPHMIVRSVWADQLPAGADLRRAARESLIRFRSAHGIEWQCESWREFSGEWWAPRGSDRLERADCVLGPIAIGFVRSWMPGYEPTGILGAASRADVRRALTSA